MKKRIVSKSASIRLIHLLFINMGGTSTLKKGYLDGSTKQAIPVLKRLNDTEAFTLN